MQEVVSCPSAKLVMHAEAGMMQCLLKCTSITFGKAGGACRCCYDADLEHVHGASHSANLVMHAEAGMMQPLKVDTED